MSRPSATILLLAFLGACADGSPTGPAPVDESGGYRVLAAPVVCDSCDAVSFEIAGPDVGAVTSARFRRSDGPRTELTGAVEFRAFTGDSGTVLRTAVTFDGRVDAGDYDLVLETVDGTGATTTRTISRALIVTRARPGRLPQPGDGTVVLTVNVTGTERDTVFRVSIGGVNYSVEDQIVRAGTSYRFPLPQGSYGVTLADIAIAANCTVNFGPYRSINVTAGTIAAVTFDVVCETPAHVRVQTVTTGADRPSDYYLYCLTTYGCGVTTLPANGTTDLVLPSRAYQVTLGSVPSNCRVDGRNPRDLAPVAGDTISVVFTVACESLGTIRVTVAGTGTNVDTFFWLTDPVCEFGFCNGYRLTLTSEVTLRVAAGSYRLELTDVAPNCIVAPNPFVATVTAGGLTEARFSVGCS